MREWNTYLEQPIDCKCGRIHTSDIKEIIIKEDAARDLAGLVKKNGYKHPFLVSDIHTELVAGIRLKQVLKENDIAFDDFIFSDEELIADEAALGAILTHMPSQCDLIIAVGAGTINDVCKFSSFKLKRDYYAYATAPSMDGYASNVAALIVKNMKTTLEAHNPKAIVADVDVLAGAPMDLITAGVGDILGKYVCLADWRLAKIITNEYHCEFAEGLVKESIQAVVKYADRLQARDKQAVASVMEGLILSGIVMRYIGNSRPASGSEHHMSHYWEMMFMLKQEHCALHGTKVGIGTVIGLKLYHQLPQLLKSLDGIEAVEFDETAWAGEIKKRFAQASDEVVKLEAQVHKNSREAVAGRLNSMRAHLEEISEIEKSLPRASEIMALLELIGAPSLPGEIGVDRQMFIDSIIYAKELRNRYGLLQMLFDMDQSRSAAEKLADEFEKE